MLAIFENAFLTQFYGQTIFTATATLFLSLLVMAIPPTLARLAWTRDRYGYLPQIISNAVAIPAISTLILVAYFALHIGGSIDDYFVDVELYLAMFMTTSVFVGCILFAFVIRTPSKDALIAAEYVFGLGDPFMTALVISCFAHFNGWALIIVGGTYAVWARAIDEVHKAGLQQDRELTIEDGCTEKSPVKL